MGEDLRLRGHLRHGNFGCYRYRASIGPFWDLLMARTIRPSAITLLLQKMISDVDDDGSGTIEYEEFLKMMTHKILNRDPKDEILKAFRLFDDDETGKISFKNLKRVAKELGERMTDEELQEMVDEADRDGDGEVNEEEFLRIMKKTNLF